MARQAYSADTFCLGLSLLHLLTGEAPYEELLQDIHCPAYLAEGLSRLWCRDDNDNIDDPFYVVCELVKTLDYSDEDDNSSTTVPGGVLLDTIYRYLVLFGGKEGFVSSCPWGDNPAWLTIVDAVGLDQVVPEDLSAAPTAGKGKKRGGARGPGAKQALSRSICISSFARDVNLWSIHRGTHAIVSR